MTDAIKTEDVVTTEDTPTKRPRKAATTETLAISGDPADAFVTRLGVYKLHPSAELPSKGTLDASCYDVRANFGDLDVVTIRYPNNTVGNRTLDITDGKKSVVLRPNERMLVSTQLALDIPRGYDVKVYPRSGLSYKDGITLSNCVAVIDSDYTNELFISIVNISEAPFTLTTGDRIAQIALERLEPTKLVELSEAPGFKGDRVGGLGSTGVA